MKTIGLTHGTFYAHFPSKEALVAETYAKRIDDVIDGLLASADHTAPGGELDAVLDRYLSAAHRDDQGGGCVFAALTADVGREKTAARAEFSDAIKRYFTRLTAVLPPSEHSKHGDSEMVLASGMLGAILLARAIDDPALSDRILRACRKFYSSTLADKSRLQGGKRSIDHLRGICDEGEGGL
jgi:TetR/AcrR family transcriptional repressor of nem operon